MSLREVIFTRLSYILFNIHTIRSFIFDNHKGLRRSSLISRTIFHLTSRLISCLKPNLTTPIYPPSIGFFVFNFHLAVIAIFHHYFRMKSDYQQKQYPRHLHKQRQHILLQTFCACTPALINSKLHLR